METKKELQKEIDRLMGDEISPVRFIHNVKIIVSRMPDDENAEVTMKLGNVCDVSNPLSFAQTKPEPSLLEVAMYLFGNSLHHNNLNIMYPSISECFDLAEKLIAENERIKK